MKTFRFAHIADAHLGAWPKDEALRVRLRESVLRALESVEQEGCEFLILAGDFFHTPYPDPGEVAPVAQRLLRLKEKGVRIYAVFGSHDFVLHHTSWLDVLSDSGLFVRIAPTPVVHEGEKWVLPWVRDERTGAVLAGVSGRAQGLDRLVYDSMDPREFLAQDGFRIFVFHAGILEYLPSGLAGKIEGVSVGALPKGCGYYAGGHIHATYSGPGPEGSGILVNPGAVFGTSTTDLENIHSGKTRAGLVIVDVQEGRAAPRWVVTTPREVTAVVEVDTSGCDQLQVVERFRQAVPKDLPPGTLLVPRLTGTPAHTLDLTQFSEVGERLGIGTLHLDVDQLRVPSEQPEMGPVSAPYEIEGDILGQKVGSTGILGSSEKKEVEVARELLHALGVPKADMESREDYRKRMVRVGLRVLSAENLEEVRE